jgi:hypothetical protein
LAGETDFDETDRPVAMSTQEQDHRWALTELQSVVEDVFFTAALFRTTGDPETARRLGDIGDQLHELFLKAKKGKVAS